MANESDEVSGLQGKTPISYLQEMCNKRGITPQYDLIANEGAVHEPLFVFKVAAGEYIGTGKGTSKKKAKHNAAVSLLNQMGVLPALVSGQPSNANGSGGHFSMEPKENDGRNPVGELQEMTQKRLWPPPVYEFTNEIGPAHAREFVCNVRLFNICEQAVGKSKKLAKRNAALAMLNAIRLGGVEPNIQVVEPDEYEDEDPIALHDSSSVSQPKSLSSHYSQQGTVVDGESDRVRKKISPMFQTSSKKTKVGPVLEALQSLSDEELNADDVCKRLEDLALEQKFTVTYLDMPEISLSGKHQCIVNLSTNPQTACFGSSAASPSSARVAAALNALHHCRIMTTRTNM